MVRKSAKAEVKTPNILGMARYSNTTVPSRATKFDDKLPIIPFFKEDGNGFIQTLIDIYGRSATHKSCISIKNTLACGDGIMINRKDGQPYVKNIDLEAFLNDVNSTGETAQDIVNRMLFDEILTGSHCGQIVTEVLDVNGVQVPNKKNVSVTHEDVSTFRYATPTDNKLVDCWLSYSWNDDLKKYTPDLLNKYAKRLPIFYGQVEAESVIHSVGYQTGRNYYAIPDYFTLSFKRWADIEYAVPTYNHSRIENKFMPSGTITLIGQPTTEQTGNEYCQDVLDVFTGEGNNSKLLVTLVDQKESAPIVELFPDAQSGIFLDLDALGKENILTAHQMHPAILMAVSKGLSNASELKVVVDQFYKMVIEGYQKSVLRTWDRILKYAGFEDYTLDISNNSPISLLGNIDLSKVLSVNEQRTELGYAELPDMQSEKSLADKLGVENVRLMQGYLSDVNLTREQKQGILKVLFNLQDSEIQAILPNVQL
jgi:hypothetical protein